MGLGCNNLARPLVMPLPGRGACGPDLGITFFDTADVYPAGESGMSLTHPAPLGTFPWSL
jgi:aryl-alcohol dehydrogenase-like predicted oxidoreductase